MKNSGVYAIKNTITNKVYVGSSKNMTKRKANHFSLLRHNKHYNAHLQSSFNKYGIEAFEWIVLEMCGDLAEKEKNWICKLEATNPTRGYNLAAEPYAACKGVERELVRGSLHPKSKLIEADILTIFRLYENGSKVTQIAKEFKVDYTNISLILKGRSWSHMNIGKDTTLQINNKSGYTGVYFHKKSGKWISEIVDNKVYRRLGSFTNKEDAIKARKEAEVSRGV